MSTAINWPFETAWLRDGAYGFSSADLHSKMATRLGRAWLRIGATGPAVFTAAVHFETEDALQEFLDWEFHTLKAGQLKFNGPVQVGSQIRQMEIRFVDRTEPRKLIGKDHWVITATFETIVGVERSYIEYAGLINFNDLLIG